MRLSIKTAKSPLLSFHSLVVMTLFFLTSLFASSDAFLLPQHASLSRSAPSWYQSSPLFATGNKNQNEEFWKQQQSLAKEMSDAASKSLKDEQMEKYQERLVGLVSDSFLFSMLIFCLLWGFSSNPFTGISYLFGALFGTAYSYGLGKYVETLGGSAMETESVQGAGVGQARFAFLILLFVIVGKFRALQEIPAIAGFFTYQLASLSQGLREYDD